MEDSNPVRCNEESLSETPRPQANSTTLRKESSTLIASIKNVGASASANENDLNFINRLSLDRDERSSVSSFNAKSFNGTHMSKSSLGIVNVDQVSDFCSDLLTDFEFDNDSVSCGSRKSDIENHLRQVLQRQSLSSDAPSNSIRLPKSGNGAENSSRNSVKSNSETGSFFQSSVKDDSEAGNIFGCKMDSASFQSLGFGDDEFKSQHGASFLDQLENDEKLCAKKKTDSILDHAVDGSLSGIMSGELSMGSDDRLSMSEYLKKRCYSISELDKKNLESVNELDEFSGDPRKSISSGPSDDSTYNWSRVMRGSLFNHSFGVDLNASTASSTVSVTEIAKIFREQPSSATPRAIIDALLAGGDGRSKADTKYQDCNYKSYHSGTASNHSPPERLYEPSGSVRRSNSSSLPTNEMYGPLSELSSNKMRLQAGSDDMIDRTSPNSCKSVPVSKPSMRELPSSPRLSRLSIDDRFLAAHSTPSAFRSAVNGRKSLVPDSTSSISGKKLNHCSSNSGGSENGQILPSSSNRGSDFDLTLSEHQSENDRFDSAAVLASGNPGVEFSQIDWTNDGNFSSLSNSDNECVPNDVTPTNSNSMHGYDKNCSNLSAVDANNSNLTSKDESTLTPNKVLMDLSSSTKTSETLTHQSRLGAVPKRWNEEKTSRSSMSSLPNRKTGAVYRSTESVHQKLNNQKYVPFESPLVNPHHQNHSNLMDTASFYEEQDPLSRPDNSFESNCRFWLSESENLDRGQVDHSISTLDCTVETMSDCNDNETTQLSSLTGSLMTEVLANSSILCELDGESSKIKLNMDDGGVGSSSNSINAGIHCIGTPVDIVIPVLNKSKYDIHWQISYSVSPVDRNQSTRNLAKIILPHETFVVLSHRKTNVHLIIIPLIATAADVTVQIESRFRSKSGSGILSTEKSSISQRIRIVGEDPQLSILSSSGVIYFGKLPNGSVKSENIILQNTGHSRLPVKFSIEDSNKEEVYQGHTIIEAGDVWSNDVNVFAALLSASDVVNNDGVANIMGALKIRLNVDKDIIKGSQSLGIIQLKVHVYPVQLLYSSLCSPLTLIKPKSSHICSEALDIKNGSKIPLDISVSVKVDDERIKSSFDIRPSKISMSPDQLVRFVVSFNTKNCTAHKVNAMIHLQVEPRGITFKSPVEVLIHSAPPTLSKTRSCPKLNLINSNEPTNFNGASRPTSPTSSIGSAVGQMQLACDVDCLMWSSVPIHCMQIRSCLLKNCGAHREKLLFQLSDNNNCFKIVKSEKDSSFVSELKMSLNPAECKKLSVALFPYTSQIQASGRITITRISQDHNSSLDSNGTPVKRVLPLYGFCGTCDVKISGLNKDTEEHFWIYPDTETFESMFRLENNGDSSAFMKIVLEQSSEDYVQPFKSIIPPGESTVVSFSVNLSAIRIEKLLEKQKKDVVQVSTLLLYYGNESSRKRIRQILNKCKKKGIKLSSEIEQKIQTICDFSSDQDISVDQLFDSVKNVDVLLDDIEVVKIGVLMERSALESALLDTSPIFDDLNTTIREVSVLSPASSMTITPQALPCGRSLGKKVMETRQEEGFQDFIPNSVYSNDYHIIFPVTVVNHNSITTIKVYNSSQVNVQLVLKECNEPFYIPSESFLLKKNWYCNFRIFFRPQRLGVYLGFAKFSVILDDRLATTLDYELTAEAIAPK